MHKPGPQVSRATISCTAAPNVCGPSVRNVFQVTLLAPKFLENLDTPDLRAFLIIEYHHVCLHVGGVRQQKTDVFLSDFTFFVLPFLRALFFISFFLQMFFGKRTELSLGK